MLLHASSIAHVNELLMSCGKLEAHLRALEAMLNEVKGDTQKHGAQALSPQP